MTLRTAARAPVFCNSTRGFRAMTIACVLNLQHAATLLPTAVVASGVAR